MTRTLLVLLLATACGGASEPSAQPAATEPAPAPAAQPAPAAEAPADRASRCASFVDRSRPVMQEMATSAGKSFGPEHEAELRTMCEQKPGSKDEVLIDCVLGAADEPTVKTCWKDAMQRYIDASKAARDGAEK